MPAAKKIEEQNARATLERPAIRSREARTRGPHLVEPQNVPDAGTPGWGRKRQLRYTDADLHGEERHDLLRRIRDCSLSGMTDFEIESTLGLKYRTLARWAFDDPAVAACLEVPKDIAMHRVTAALYAKAIGYSFQSVDIRVVNGAIVKTPIVEHVPPDTTAIIWFQKNMRPDLWQDKKEVNFSGTVDGTLTDGMDPRKLAMALMAVLNEAANHAVRTIEPMEIDDGTQHDGDED